MMIEMILALIAVVAALYHYLTRQYSYWKKKQVAFIEPNFPLGTTHDQFFGISDVGTTYQKYYTQYKKQGLKYVGAFMMLKPTLIILDLDLCKQILLKDFNHFMTRDDPIDSSEYISKHLASLTGQEWRHMRTRLTPTFTSGKMKSMFVLMEKCVNQLQEHLEDLIPNEGQFSVKDLIARFTTDIIATCAFGLDVNSIKDHENEFFKTGQLIFVPKRATMLKIIMFRSLPKLSRFLNLKVLNPRVTKLLTKVVKETVQYRTENNVSRNDFIDLLLKTKDNKSLEDVVDKVQSKPLISGKEQPQDLENDELTLEEMTAQAFVFFAAGFETASSTTSFCLYELAKNPEVQTRLCREIDEVLQNHGGKITYQALQEMTYMDQVLNETLRMYASLPFLPRKCTERYQIPDTDLVIDEGVRVHIPTYAIHHDPDIYPDPYKFDPDRFTEENSKARHHYAFLPFGEGPRMCIGMRFGKLQVKIGLVAILSRYELSPAPDTPSKMEINPLIFLTTSKHPYSLRITKRRDQQV